MQDELSRKEFAILAAGHGGASVTQDGGRNWSTPKGLELRKTEWLVAAAFDATGAHGVVGGTRGSVFVTRDGGQNWSVPQDLQLKETERLVTAAFDADGTHGVVGGDEGSVFVTRDGGQNWSVPQDLQLKETERLVTVAFDADGAHGVVGGTRGSVFVTRDGGQNWSVPQDLQLKETERLVTAAFDADGTHGVVGGDEGSVFVTRDGGKTWNSTVRDSQGASFVDFVNGELSERGRNYLAVDANGVVHLLTAYLDVAKWESRSLSEIRDRVGNNRVLRESTIGREIISFLDSAIDTRPRTDDGGTSEDDNDNVLIGSFEVGDVTVMRIVTLIVLFFLVQILVRLHQYSLRLAAFWDSRADAVLLAKSFACRSAESFDDLVAALAPDAYDFKPPPKSGHETAITLVDRLRPRGGSRSP